MKPGRKRIFDRIAYMRSYGQTWHAALRNKVIVKLGGKCNWPDCNWSDPRALQVDHIHGGGRAERWQLGSRNMYIKILRMEQPQKEYQLLCANHNQIKRIENKENPSSKGPVLATCHPDRPHHSKGLCNECYQKQWYLAKKDRKLKEKLNGAVQNSVL